MSRPLLGEPAPTAEWRSANPYMPSMQCYNLGFVQQWIQESM
ncbi:MAG TPA: hypothetical protein VGO47_09515 [Chlamydiales bacterium]|nr:hypothetical protein [Chlamydiales bacterium]